MSFTIKIQPIESHVRPLEAVTPFETVKPVAKSRFKGLFERQFISRTSTPPAMVKEKSGGGVDDLHFNKDGFTALAGGGEFEPSSVCLANMVQNFIEDSDVKQSAMCSWNRCNCFNENGDDSSEPFDFGDSNMASSGEACELLKYNSLPVT